MVYVGILLQILNSLTAEVLEHEGTFRNPDDQIQFIATSLKDGELVFFLLVLTEKGVRFSFWCARYFLCMFFIRP